MYHIHPISYETCGGVGIKYSGPKYWTIRHPDFEFFYDYACAHEHRHRATYNAPRGEVTIESLMAYRLLVFAPSPAPSGAGPAELFALPNLTIDSRFVLIFPACMVRLNNVDNSAGPAPLEAGLGANAS